MIAIGDPYGVGSTVTAGIISALHRGITGIGAYDRYIQTDAAINMGNSGGPMFDLNGNVIGINSALISPTGASVGIGLAIPAGAAKPVIDALMKGQRPSRGYLGVGLQPLDEDLAPSLGLPKDSGEIVRSVVAGGPAARGGSQQGDVIVRVNGQQVTPDQTVSYLVANTPVGARVPLEIIRGGKRATVTSGSANGRPKKRLARSSAAAAARRHDAPAGPRRRRPWPVACAADARSRPRGQPAGDGARASSSPRSIRTATPPTGLQRGDLIVRSTTSW